MASKRPSIMALPDRNTREAEASRITPIDGSKRKPKVDPNHESYAYNWRSRENLKRGK